MHSTNRPISSNTGTSNSEVQSQPGNHLFSTMIWSRFSLASFFSLASSFISYDQARSVCTLPTPEHYLLVEKVINTKGFHSVYITPGRQTRSSLFQEFTKRRIN